MTDEEKWRMEYEQASDWARHYSTVRMTIVPALAGLSFTILGLSWPEDGGYPENGIICLALTIWVIAFAILWMFSALEVREVYYVKLLRILLLEKPVDTATRLGMLERFGGQTAIGNALTTLAANAVLIIPPPHLSRPAHRWESDPWHDYPFRLGVGFTLLFVGWLLVMVVGPLLSL